MSSEGASVREIQVLIEESIADCVFEILRVSECRITPLSSLVVAWSPMLQVRCVSLWRVSLPEFYSVDKSMEPTMVTLIGIIQAHNSWITAISLALLVSDSSNPQLR